MKNFIGEKIVLSNTKLHANLSLNHSDVEGKTLLKHLDAIQEFYSEIGLTNVVFIIEMDIKTIT